MTLAEYKQTLTTELGPRTIMFLLRDDEILLGLKKRGFGVGKVNGIGGKLEPGETEEQAAVRETEEEIGVKVKNVEYRGTTSFYFPFKDINSGWGQKGYIYVAREWEGEPKESEEMLPSWYKVSDLPYEKMWSDARLWIPDIAFGKSLDAEFMFGEELEVLEVNIKYF